MQSSLILAEDYAIHEVIQLGRLLPYQKNTRLKNTLAYLFAALATQM
jgi:hypothetical protein